MKIKYIDLKPYMGAESKLPGIDGIWRPETHGVFKIEKGANGDCGVFCNGQSITVSRRCRKMHIAGFSFKDSQRGEMELFFRDENASEKVEVYFLDWREPYEYVLGFDDGFTRDYSKANVLMQYKTAENMSAYIYEKTYTFPAARYLETIKLPCNKLIVIQAVSVE